MALKPNKEKIVQDIIIELEAGSNYSTALALNGTKWQLPKRTFDRYWKMAQEVYSERQQAIQKQLERDSITAAQERLKKAILTKDERMQIASDIARGKAWKVGTDIIAPTGSDRIKALDFLAKIEGDYAASKQDITTQGESLNASIDKQKFEQLLAAAREGIKANKSK